MSGVLDAQVHIGRETTYGEIAAPTRSIEALEDFATAQREGLQSVGMRAGLQGVRTDRRRNYIKGAEGDLTLHPQEVGFGMLLRAAIGDADIQQVDSTDAYLQTFVTTSAAPDESLTFVIGRPPADPSAAVIPWTYTGGVVHEFSLEQEVGDGDGGQLVATFGMDFRNELTEGLEDDLNDSGGGLSLPAAVYPDAEFVYGWPELSVTIGNEPVGDTRSFSLTMTHELNRERYYMRRSTFKKRPIRTGIPEFSGSLAFDYENNDIYELIQTSEVLPLVAEWRHPDPDAIDTGQTYFLRVTCNVQFTGNTPQVSLDDLPNQEVEFVCLHDGTNPMVKVEYQSTDTDF